METDNRLPTGEWNGFYLERHRSERGWMHLYLSFEDGKIKGEGTDYVGPWVATGDYDAESGKCNFVKQYLGQHQVVYSGQAGLQGIMGQWSIGFTHGEFHIWPRSMSELNEMYLTEDLSAPTSTSPKISEEIEEDFLAKV
jgi:hypothetical protein